MTIFKFAVLRGLRNPFSIIFNFVLPFTLIFISPLWTGEHPTGFYYMAMMFMYGAFLISRGIVNDKLDGTIIRIFAAPVSSLGYLTQNLLASMLPLFIQICAVCSIGTVLYGWNFDFSILIALCYTSFTIASITFTFAWSCLFKNRELSYAVFSVLMSVVAMIGGFWIPISLLPEPIRFVGALFPAYWASNGINSLLTLGLSSEYWLSISVIIFFAIAYLLYGGKR